MGERRGLRDYRGLKLVRDAKTDDDTRQTIEALDDMAEACRPEVRRFVRALTSNLARQGLPTQVAEAVVFAAIAAELEDQANRLEGVIDDRAGRG